MRSQRIIFRRLHAAAFLGALAAVVVAGCRKQEMADQPRYLPETASEVYSDGTSARPLVLGTVPRGHLETDEHRFFGLVNGLPAATFPDDFPTAGEPLRAALSRGRERFTIFCAMCHGQTGDGDGIVVQRGFTPPPSYHSDRLRTAPVGHLFDVITNGQGAMYSYGDRIPPDDRWDIVAYIRVLQLSRSANAAELSAADRAALEEPQP